MLDTIIDSYSKVILADLTEDSYSIVKSAGENGCNIEKSTNKLSTVLKEFGNLGYIHPDDMMDYERYTSLDHMREFFVNTDGKNTFWMKYRRRYDNDADNAYHWSVLRVIASKEYTNDRQTVYMFIDNIDKAYTMGGSRLDSVLLAICNNFQSVFYVNLDTDIILTFRLNKAMPVQLREYVLTNNDTYLQVVDTYIDKRVCREDRKRVTELTRPEYIKKSLQEKQAYSFDFMLKPEYGQTWFRMKFARLDDDPEIHDFALAFENITEEKLEENDYYRQGRKILVVEDSEVNRSILVTILEDTYEVVEAADGQEAYDLLENNEEDIAVIITDLEMPVMTGYEFIAKVRSERRYDSLPIIVATASSDIHIEVKCLKLGASDFISKPYNPEIVRHRVNGLIKLRESTAMLNTLEKDSLTGLYAKEFFYQRVEEILEKNPDEIYHILCTDIENFKVVNEKYGADVGDKVLAYLAEEFPRTIPNYVVGGRISGDRFAVLRRDIPVDNIGAIMKRINENAPVPNVVVKYGVYHADRNHTAQEMCDRALIAVESIKGVYGKDRLEYDDDLRKNLLKQQQIIDNMENALSEEQFKVYYQPKHDVNTGAIAGAEALVRWIHPIYGFMNPGDFIPIFEQNGFVTSVDSYVCVHVCKTINEWRKKGLPLVPVSINLSRRDFEKNDLADQIMGCADRYGIPHELLHIEITESAFSDNPRKIAEIVNTLHNSGFAIELDDFGSGYSSLAALSSMDIDIMKLDMSLIRNDDPKADRNPLEFSMQLAKMLKLKTVAEGVETDSQKERIMSLGGDYIQGYYYSKPLPQSDFEEYLVKTEVRKNDKSSII